MNKDIDILLVEDNPHEAKLTMANLKALKMSQSIFHVDDGSDALDFVFARGEYSDRETACNPKMILLDLNLPKIGGLEVLRQIKENQKTKGIPIIILSSSREDSDVIAGYMLGVNSYVVKPVEYNSFTKVISDIGNYWMLINESGALVLAKDLLTLRNKNRIGEIDSDLSMWK